MNREVKLYEPIFGSPTATTVWRGVMSVVSVWLLFVGFTVNKGFNNIYFVSHIGSLLVAAYFVTGFLYSLSDKNEKASLTRWFTSLFQLTISVQFMIFVFYWALMSYDDFARILSNRDQIEA